MCMLLPICTREVPSLRSFEVPVKTFSSLAKLARLRDGLLKISSMVPVSTILPWRSRAALFVMVCAWKTLWVAMIIVVSNWWLVRWMVSSIMDTVSGSRFAVGSSSRRSGVFRARALARVTRCCSPPESFLAWRLA